MFFFRERESRFIVCRGVFATAIRDFYMCREIFLFPIFPPPSLILHHHSVCVCVFVFYFNFLLASILHQGSFWLGQDLSRFKPSILVLLFKTSFYFKPLDGKTTLKWTYPRYPLIETKNSSGLWSFFHFTLIVIFPSLLSLFICLLFLCRPKKNSTSERTHTTLAESMKNCFTKWGWTENNTR